MKYEVLGDNVLVRLHEPPAQVGRILLPDSAKEKSCRGEVLGVGPGKLHESGFVRPVGVWVGQVILFRRWPSQDVPGEKDLAIVEAQHVLAAVSGE